MRIHFLIAGSCFADNSHVYVNAPKGKTIFPAFFAYIHHPVLGNILFDTGYSEHFFSATKGFPNRIYRLVTPVLFSAEDSAKAQLKKQFNLLPEDINYIIISHFHGDHIAGLRDFNNATFICSKKAYQHFNAYPRLIAFSKGYLKELLPEDFMQRVIFIEEEFEATEHPDFKSTWLWKQAGIRFIDLPGHARGQIGIRLNAIVDSTIQDVFLVADAAWSMLNITKNLPPAPIVKLFVDDYVALKTTLDTLHSVHQKSPQTYFIITHCKETLSKYISF